MFYDKNKANMTKSTKKQSMKTIFSILSGWPRNDGTAIADDRCYPSQNEIADVDL